MHIVPQVVLPERSSYFHFFFPSVRMLTNRKHGLVTVLHLMKKKCFNLILFPLTMRCKLLTHFIALFIICALRIRVISIVPIGVFFFFTYVEGQVRAATYCTCFQALTIFLKRCLESKWTVVAVSDILAVNVTSWFLPFGLN